MQRVTICTIKYFIVRIIVGTRINSYFIGIGTKSHQRDSSTVIIGFAKVAYRFLKIRPYTSYVLLVCGCNCYGICLERSFDTVDTKYGKLDVKKILKDGKEVVYPEYSSAKELAVKNNVALKEIYKMR